MAKSSGPIELHPDAWARFERAAGVVAKTPPQHRVKVTAKKNKKMRRGKGPKNKA
jgi:hypothetical protein